MTVSDSFVSDSVARLTLGHINSSLDARHYIKLNKQLEHNYNIKMHSPNVCLPFLNTADERKCIAIRASFTGLANPDS